MQKMHQGMSDGCIFFVEGAKRFLINVFGKTGLKAILRRIIASKNEVSFGMLKLFEKNYWVYPVFIWHGFFLALTMSMLDFNTVFPSLIAELSHSKLILGFLFSIILGAPGIFNLFFSHFLHARQYKKRFLLLGIYLRSISFLGMAFFTYYFGTKNSFLTMTSFFGWIFLFAASGGFAGLAFSDII
jgi:hypothetical protein